MNKRMMRAVISMCEVLSVGVHAYADQIREV